VIRLLRAASIAPSPRESERHRRSQRQGTPPHSTPQRYPVDWPVPFDFG
jgi:hypothetical protein